MKAMLDLHAARLEPAERKAIWERVATLRASAARPRFHPALPVGAALATAAMAVLIVVSIDREPVRVPTPRVSEVAPAAPIRERVARDVVTPPAESVPRPAAPRIAPVAPPAPTPVTHIVEPEPVPSPPVAPVRAGAVAGRVVDAYGNPVPYASVAVVGNRKGALTDESGRYRIEGLPPATYALRVQVLGHEAQDHEGVHVESGSTVAADLRLGAAKVVRRMEELEVKAEKRIDMRSSTTKQTISGEKLREIPVDNLREAVGTMAGTATKPDALQPRGGRVGGTVYNPPPAATTWGRTKAMDNGGTALAPARPPVIPTTGGTRLPNDEAFDSMFFKEYGVNPFVPADEDPFSTFAVDVDAASYTLTRRYLGLGELPPAGAVRVEEFVNFFAQGYPRFAQEDFRILVDGAPSPFGPGYHLIRVGIKGRDIVERERKSAQLTFVIDVSGSMAREDRLELVKRALRLLVDRLRADDAVGIVIYGTNGRVLLEPVALGGSPGPRRSRGAGRQRVLEAIEQLRPEGSTNAEEGLRLGYQMARRAYRPSANNRIVLCSDGVANVGRTGPESILAQVRNDADLGIHLTTIGFGMGNYNDVLMEQLADRGDGNHYYVDDLDEAHRVLVENLTGTLQTIAKDAKIQVEFDSTQVLRYRLLGFENRDVADRDFRNDKVDAGEIGAGHEVTALYEVKLAPGVARGTLATVRLRYARPEREGSGAPQVREIEQRFDAALLARRFEDAAPHLRRDSAVAEFAEILRGSYWAREGRLSDVLAVARASARDLRDDASAEFVTLVEKAAAIRGRSKPAEEGAER